MQAAQMGRGVACSHVALPRQQRRHGTVRAARPDAAGAAAEPSPPQPTSGAQRISPTTSRRKQGSFASVGGDSPAAQRPAAPLTSRPPRSSNSSTTTNKAPPDVLGALFKALFTAAAVNQPQDVIQEAAQAASALATKLQRYIEPPPAGAVLRCPPWVGFKQSPC